MRGLEFCTCDIGAQLLFDQEIAPINSIVLRSVYINITSKIKSGLRHLRVDDWNVLILGGLRVLNYELFSIFGGAVLFY